VTRVAIVGTGLIGASVGLAARRAGSERVTGWDPDASHLATAAERGAVEPVADLPSALEGAEIAVVAAPVTALPVQVLEVLDASGPSVTVTDVGSTKGGVCEAAAGVARFVGGHPICGSEARGPERATAEIFEGATWFLTPVAATNPDSYTTLHSFVSSLGAVPVAISPEAHDRLVAVTSHLPHALANVLLNQAGGGKIDGHDPLDAAGGSLRDMTRVAGANPRIWVDIFLENREALAASLAEYRRRIEQVEAALAEGDAGFLARWIGEASGNKRRLLETAYDDAGELQRLRVHIPDRPGVIAGIAQALGAERINIAGFDLQHLSSERGGTLAILVAGEGEAARAAALLEGQGYGVVVAPVIEDES
jgi:prephenate dehydrogenase